MKGLDKLDGAAMFDPALCPNKCGRKYRGKSRKSNLKVHLKYECGVPWQFQCQYLLPPEFFHKAHLKVHIGVVHGILLMK